MNIRIGKTPYLNALPFYAGLESENGLKLDFVEGSPSDLNARVRSGEIQASLISSLEYAKAPDQYLLLPGLSISAREACQSVGLVWKGEIRDLGGQEIFFRPASFSSVALLDILLKERFGIDDATLSPGDSSHAVPDGPLLVIGDEALRLRRKLRNSPIHFYDLGSLWWEWMRKPFCFALWVVRRDFYERHRDTVKLFAGLLKDRVRKNLSAVDGIVFGEDLKKYLLNFDYGLDADILEGLYLFYERAAKLGWVSRIHQLEFVP